MTTDKLLLNLAQHLLNEATDACDELDNPVAAGVLVGLASACNKLAADVNAERQSLIDRVQS